MSRIINLLPTSERRALSYSKVYDYVRNFVAFSVLTYVLLVGVLVGWRMTLAHNLDNVDSDIAKVKQIIQNQDNESVKAKVQAQNAIISDYNNMASAYPHWSKVLQGLSALVPNDVILTSLSANTKTGKIDIAGIATTRDAEAVRLRNNLSMSPLFKNVNLPFENLQKPSNVPFSYTFFVNDNVLSDTNVTTK